MKRQAISKMLLAEISAYRCINTSNQVRTFTRYDEAYRFVMREGDASRLWSLEKVW